MSNHPICHLSKSKTFPHLLPNITKLVKDKKTSILPSLSFATNNETNQQLTTKITIKINSKQNFPIDYKNYLNIHREIKRYKPSVKIKNAYINQQNFLIIKVSSVEDERLLTPAGSKTHFNMLYKLYQKILNII